MTLIDKDHFICLDCETTGLDPHEDRVIEVAAVCFTFSGDLDSTQTLIDPERLISAESIVIHNITDKMVEGMPKIAEVLPELFKFVGKHPIVGHGISLDLKFLEEEAKRHSIPYPLTSNIQIDTLRMARLYGESPVNSLEHLRKHFNIKPEGAHRAMSDVIVNIAVFKHLSKSFKTTKQLLERLKKPILLRNMPLGKHKGRSFKEIPHEYLLWARHQNFDQDLLFSIQTELNKRKKKHRFTDSANPFSTL